MQTWYYEKWRVHQLDYTISYASRLRSLIQNCHEAALAGSHGTRKGDNYLRHDLVPSNHDINTFIFLIIMHVDVIIFAVQVFLPTNMANTHWFLVVINPRRREIQILDSLFRYVVSTQVVHVVRF